MLMKQKAVKTTSLEILKADPINREQSLLCSAQVALECHYADDSC